MIIDLQFGFNQGLQLLRKVFIHFSMGSYVILCPAVVTISDVQLPPKKIPRIFKAKFSVSKDSHNLKKVHISENIF